MKRIMIVDDDNLVRWGLSKNIPAICKIPVEIKSVDNGTDATHEIYSNFYDVCFLDVNLPDTNGIEVMKRIKKVSPKTEVIIMTAEELDEERKKMVDDMAYQFISKPFDFYQVKFILKNVFEKDGSSNSLINMEKRRSKRKYERKPFIGTFEYSITTTELEDQKTLNLKGNVVDICDAGIGVKTDYSLYAGQAIEIEGMEKRSGIVKWISMIGNNEFRVGIEFV